MPPRKRNEPKTEDRSEGKDSSRRRKRSESLSEASFSEASLSDASLSEPPKKRSNFNPNVKDIFNNYFIHNLDYCYPSSREKSLLATQTGLNPTQVNNYLINARRRILPKLRAARGLPALNNPRRRKSGGEGCRRSAAKKERRRSKLNEDESGHDTSDNTLPSGASSPASTGDENDEVFLPNQPMQPEASSETDMLRRFAPVTYQPDVASLFHTEEYQRQDGSASPEYQRQDGSASPHSVSSSQSSFCGLPHSPADVDSEDSSSKPRSPSEYEAAFALVQLKWSS